MPQRTQIVVIFHDYSSGVSESNSAIIHNFNKSWVAILKLIFVPWTTAIGVVPESLLLNSLNSMNRQSPKVVWLRRIPLVYVIFSDEVAKIKFL